MGFLSHDTKKSTVVTTTQNWADSFNTNTTNTSVTEGSGNTTLTINDTSAGIPSWLAPLALVSIIVLIGAATLPRILKTNGG
jgi:hypothetical protein